MPNVTRQQTERLKAFVNPLVKANGCDHSHRFTRQWAEAESIDWDDLLDVLEENGGHCDCEVLLNLPDDVDLVLHSKPLASQVDNPWVLPPGFFCSEQDTFTKRLFCDPGVGRNTHALAGETLVPAPKNAKPRKRIRKSVHFFIGCSSGLPAEIGVVQEGDLVSAADFARSVSQSGVEELRDFTFREAAFLLSKLAPLPPGTPVGLHFMETSGVVGKREELRIHKVFFR